MDAFGGLTGVPGEYGSSGSTLFDPESSLILAESINCWSWKFLHVDQVVRMRFAILSTTQVSGFPVSTATVDPHEKPKQWLIRQYKLLALAHANVLSLCVQ